MAQENLEIKKSYADFLKTTAPKTFKNAQVQKINAHEIKNFIKSQQQQATSINDVGLVDIGLVDFGLIDVGMIGIGLVP